MSGDSYTQTRIWNCLLEMDDSSISTWLLGASNQAIFNFPI